MSTPRKRYPTKAVSKRGPQAFKSLQALDIDIMARAENRLQNGDPPSEIAAWLQSECKVLVDMKPEALKKTLERYRNTILRQKVMDRIAISQIGQSLTGIVRRVNALDEMDAMVILQKDRLGSLLLKEKSMPTGMLLKQATEELRLLKDITMDAARLHLETGVLPRASKSVKGSIVDENGTFKSFSWTEEQERLFRELELAVTDVTDSAEQPRSL